MANPDNITLRSEKGSFLTFEEMDLNLTELQNQIYEYNQFLVNDFNPLEADHNDLRLEWSNYQVTINNRLDINEQAIIDINNDQTVQDGRISQNESDILALQLGGGLTYQGNHDPLVEYGIGDVVTYTDGLDYISVANNNTQEPASGTNTNYWIVLTAKSIAEFVSYDNSTSGLTATDVQAAIDELSNDLTSSSISDFNSPEYSLQSASFTAQVNEWYSLDASTAFDITLPATPTLGDTIEFLLASGDASVNNITILRNSSTIEDLAEDMTIDTNFPRAFAVYYNGSTWRVRS